VAFRRLATMSTRSMSAIAVSFPYDPWNVSRACIVLRRSYINRLRIAQGADPLYELPTACTAWDGGGCVLERAFEDLGVLVVDYRRAYGRRIEFSHGLGDFARDFDAGRYPELLACR
jgi:hypothetical protein